MIESSISLKYSEILKLYIDCSFKFLNVENSKFWQLAFNSFSYTMFLFYFSLNCDVEKANTNK